MKKSIEFYINEKLFKCCPYEEWDDTYKQIEGMIKQKGYVNVFNESFLNELPVNTDVFVHLKKHTCIILTNKIFTGFLDKEGNKIYEDDTVQTPYGFTSGVYGYYDKEDEYYVRSSSPSSWSCKDYGIDDFKKYIKIKDVAYFDLKKWNNPETINEDEF